MDIEQKFLDSNGKITYTQVFDEKGKPVYEEMRDSNGNYLFDILNISDKEFYTFCTLGKETLPDEQDEEKCFEAGIITSIKRGLEYAKKESLSKST